MPHCRRTRRRRPGDSDDTEWLCPDHWRLTSPTARRRYKRLQQRMRRGEGDLWRGLARDMWERLKVQAIEREAGLS